MLVREAKDPRFGEVTVSQVEVSRDLSHAKVYVTLHADSEIAPTLSALNKAAGYLRHGLAQRLRLRYLPELHFVHDASLERASRVSALIDSAIAEDEERARRLAENEPGEQGDQ